MTPKKADSDFVRSVVISMVNTMTSYVSLNTEAFHQKPITYSWVIMSTEENNPLRPFVYYLHTRSSTLRTSLSSEEIMNAHRSIVSMDSMMNASEDTTSSYGRHLRTALTVYQLQLLLTKRSLQCMEV